MTQIVSGIVGWETITNPNVGVIGLAEESDNAARRNLPYKQYQGASIIGSMLSTILKVDGVKSCYIYDNDTGEIVTIDEVEIAAKSIYCCIDGGSENNLAPALLSRKVPGCGWTGAITKSVLEPISNKNYSVKFSRPTPVPMTIYVKVDVSKMTGITAPSIETAIKNAVLKYAQGNVEGVDGLAINVDVSPFEIGSAITVELPKLYITEVKIVKSIVTGKQIGRAHV